MRHARVARRSSETSIQLNFTIEGSGRSNIHTPIPFFSHMLQAFAAHGAFDLLIKAVGDTQIDQHHTVEDIGLMLGKAVARALTDKAGINRAGSFAFPMDESLGIVSIDLSGRPYLVFRATFKRERIGDLESDCVKEFFSGFSMGAGCNVAVYVPYGENDHHKTEAIFKAFGKALAMACSKNPRLKQSIPSTKGLLDKLM